MMRAALHVVLVDLEFLCHLHKEILNYSHVFFAYEIIIFLQENRISAILFLCPFFEAPKLIDGLNITIFRNILFIPA